MAVSGHGENVASANLPIWLAGLALLRGVPAVHGEGDADDEAGAGAA
jgi:hypothetical protein